MRSLPLALLLLRASRWFDRQLLEGLQERGWPALSPAQSLVFAYLDVDGVPPAELARRLGQTRQATSDLVRGLVHHDFVTVVANPRRRGGRLVLLSERGRALVRDATELLADLESSFGTDRVRALRELLEVVGPSTGDQGSPDTGAGADACSPGVGAESVPVPGRPRRASSRSASMS
jgi:DNA-binding MarR family transcriptional regulator